MQKLTNHMFICVNFQLILATNLIHNSGFIYICVKIINVFTCGEEISKSAVWWPIAANQKNKNNKKKKHKLKKLRK